MTTIALEIHISDEGAEIVPLHLESGSWTVDAESEGWWCVADDLGDIVTHKYGSLTAAIGAAIEGILRIHGVGE